MNIYIICAVRNAPADVVSTVRQYVRSLRDTEGHKVHFPPDDAPQGDPTGVEICRVHLAAMKEADEVHVFWDVNSKGSHFDLGMAYALGKRIKPILNYYIEGQEKSYWKVMQAWAGSAG